LQYCVAPPVDSVAVSLPDAVVVPVSLALVVVPVAVVVVPVVLSLSESVADPTAHSSLLCDQAKPSSRQLDPHAGSSTSNVPNPTK
jgi:hypothetical protein